MHLAALWCAWPILRAWWTGAQLLNRTISRKRWLVIASLLMPPLAAAWLFPAGIIYRHDRREDAAARQRIMQLNEHVAQRAVDVAFWREQVATGDLISAWVGMELLAMWEVPLRGELTSDGPGDDWQQRMQHARELIRTGLAVPETLPGAHAYSHGCDCRNCARARAADPRWRGSGPLVPSELFRCRCGATSRAEMCTIQSGVCGHL